MSELNMEGMAFWTVISGIVGSIFAWVMRVERRLSGGMTREEHQNICELRNKEVKADLQEIKDTLEEQDRRSGEYRNHVQDFLGLVSTRLAVIEDRMAKKFRVS